MTHNKNPFIIINKIMKNKKTNQMHIVLPKKKIKAMDPTIKFDENLFVEIRFFRRKKKHGILDK